MLLVYGFATGTSEAPPADAAWSRGDVGKVTSNTTVLRRLTTVLPANELAPWISRLENTELAVATHGGEVRVQTGGLVRRPAVYAAPRDSVDSTVPRSLSQDLALIESHWSLDKGALVNSIEAGPSVGTPLGAAVATESSALDRVLSLLEQQTGIRFRGDEAERLGNFEIVHFPMGSYDVT